MSKLSPKAPTYKTQEELAEAFLSSLSEEEMVEFIKKVKEKKKK